MSKHVLMTQKAEITSLCELSARIGSDPLLTQASTGNSSMKLDGVLWIKASGKWMADATRKDILIPLDLTEVRECVKQQVDPAGRYASASIETAMHAVLPHRAFREHDRLGSTARRAGSTGTPTGWSALAMDPVHMFGLASCAGD